jgi:hypothetical protein
MSICVWIKLRSPSAECLSMKVCNFISPLLVNLIGTYNVMGKVDKQSYILICSDIVTSHSEDKSNCEKYYGTHFVCIAARLSIMKRYKTKVPVY